MATVEDYINGGNYYYERREYDKAISDYSKAIELCPIYAGAYYNRGNIFYLLEQYEDAICDYNRAIELAPENSHAKKLRAKACRKLEQYKNTIRDYYERGNTDYELKQYEDAIRKFDKAIEFDPEYADAYYKKAEAEENLKRYKDAIADFRKALDLYDDAQDKSDCENHIRKIEQLLSKPVKISECTEEELGTLELFNKERIEQFFKARNEGIMWYDIEKFAEYFNLQPHEIVQIQDRLIFPLKNSAKHGRKIDF